MKYIKKILVMLILAMAVFSVNAFANVNEQNGGDIQNETADQGVAGNETDIMANPEEGADIMPNTSAQSNSQGQSTAETIFGTTESLQETGDEKYVVIGRIEKRQNEISDFMTIAGIVLVVLGAAGITCVIVWNVNARKAVRTAEEEAYKAVGKAAEANRQSVANGEDYQQYEDFEEYYEEGPVELITPGEEELEQPEHRQEQPVRRQAQPQRYAKSTERQPQPVQRQAQPVQKQVQPVQRQAQPVQKQVQPVQRQQPIQPQIRHPQRQSVQRGKEASFDTEEILREALSHIDE